MTRAPSRPPASLLLPPVPSSCAPSPSPPSSSAPQQRPVTGPEPQPTAVADGGWGGIGKNYTSGDDDHTLGLRGQGRTRRRSGGGENWGTGSGAREGSDWWVKDVRDWWLGFHRANPTVAAEPFFFHAGHARDAPPRWARG